MRTRLDSEFREIYDFFGLYKVYGECIVGLGAEGLAAGAGA